MNSTLTISEFLRQEQEQTGQIWDYVSPSRMSLFFKCPLAFRKRYLDGFVTPAAPALFVGKVVHEILAHIYRLRSVGQNCTTDDLTMFTADAWKVTLNQEPCYFVDDAEEKKYRSQVLDLVTAYTNSVPTQNEKPLAIAI